MRLNFIEEYLFKNVNIRTKSGINLHCKLLSVEVDCVKLVVPSYTYDKSVPIPGEKYYKCNYVPTTVPARHGHLDILEIEYIIEARPEDS